MQCNAIKFSDVTLDNSDDNDNSESIECDQEMFGREFFDVTICGEIFVIAFVEATITKQRMASSSPMFFLITRMIMITRI